MLDLHLPGGRVLMLCTLEGAQHQEGEAGPWYWHATYQIRGPVQINDLDAMEQFWQNDIREMDVKACVRYLKTYLARLARQWPSSYVPQEGTLLKRYSFDEQMSNPAFQALCRLNRNIAEMEDILLCNVFPDYALVGAKPRSFRQFAMDIMKNLTRERDYFNDNYELSLKPDFRPFHLLPVTDSYEA